LAVRPRWTPLADRHPRLAAAACGSRTHHLAVVGLEVVVFLGGASRRSTGAPHFSRVVGAATFLTRADR
jgi:hypothetical protein